MKCFRNEVDWVVAKDQEDAWVVWCKQTGENREDYEQDSFWAELPMDKTLRMFDVSRDGMLVVKSVSEFIEEYGRGFLMSTEY